SLRVQDGAGALLVDPTSPGRAPGVHAVGGGQQAPPAETARGGAGASFPRVAFGAACQGSSASGRRPTPGGTGPLGGGEPGHRPATGGPHRRLPVKEERSEAAGHPGLQGPENVFQQLGCPREAVEGSRRGCRNGTKRRRRFGGNPVADTSQQEVKVLARVIAVINQKGG